MTVSAIEKDVIYGELGTDPAQVTYLKSGDKVTVPLAELNDWMFLRDGEMVGGFSVDLLMKRYREAAGEDGEPSEESGN